MSFTQKSNISRAIVFALLSILALYYSLFHLISGVDVFLRIAIQVSPLLLFYRGIYLRKYKSASMLCFVLLLYFIVEVQNIAAQGNLLGESFAMVLICSLFVVSMCYSRWQQRADLLEDHSTDKTGKIDKKNNQP